MRYLAAAALVREAYSKRRRLDFSSIFIRDDNSPWTALDEVRVSKRTRRAKLITVPVTCIKLEGRG